MENLLNVFNEIEENRNPIIEETKEDAKKINSFFVDFIKKPISALCLQGALSALNSSDLKEACNKILYKEIPKSSSAISMDMYQLLITTK